MGSFRISTADARAKFPGNSISIDAAFLNRTADMGWQRDDASAGSIWVSEEVAIRIYSISGAVKTVCCLNSIENLLLIAVNHTLNCRSGNDVEYGSG